MKQGDGLAPVLFNLALEYVIRQMEIQTDSMIVYKSVQLTSYADDIGILGRSKKAVEEVFTELDGKAAEIGLCINTNKTKTVLQTKKSVQNKVIQLNNTDIEIVENFKYLGSIVNKENDELVEIKERILRANKAYFSMIDLLKSQTIHRNNKIRLYKTIIRPILCYGCETWTMQSKAEERLNSFERRILRRIFGPVQDEKGWRIRYNSELYQLYKDMEVSRFIKFRRLQWAGHVVRMDEKRIARRSFTQQMHGKRIVGKPRKRWEDEVRKDAVNILGIRAWKTKARDREYWKRRIEEAKAQIGL